MTEQAYLGGELDLFARAENWKRYLVAEIGPFLGARVLEVGAGIGGTTRIFCERAIFPERASGEWLCLDPDREHVDRIRALLRSGELPSHCATRCGTVVDLEPAELFDAILYIDVLEHIVDDADELRRSASHLAKGGHLIVLSPAHPWLFSPFDRAVGHHRRYTARTLLAAAPPELALTRLRYLDSVGLLASTANRVLLKRSVPGLREILLWDRVMVRASRRVDPIVLHRLGKSILGIWRRPS